MPPGAVAAAPQPGPVPGPPGRAAATPPPLRRRRPAAAVPPRRRRVAAPPPRRTWLEPRPRGGQSAEQPLERLLLNPGPLRNRKETGALPASTLRRHLHVKEDAGGVVHRVDEQDVKEPGVDRRYSAGTRRSAATTPVAQILLPAKRRRLLKTEIFSTVTTLLGQCHTCMEWLRGLTWGILT